MHRTHDASIAPVSGACVTPSRTKNPDGGASFASQNLCKLLSPYQIPAPFDQLRAHVRHAASRARARRRAATDSLPSVEKRSSSGGWGGACRVTTNRSAALQRAWCSRKEPAPPPYPPSATAGGELYPVATSSGVPPGVPPRYYQRSEVDALLAWSNRPPTSCFSNRTSPPPTRCTLGCGGRLGKGCGRHCARTRTVADGRKIEIGAFAAREVELGDRTLRHGGSHTRRCRGRPTASRSVPRPSYCAACQ